VKEISLCYHKCCNAC